MTQSRVPSRLRRIMCACVDYAMMVTLKGRHATSWHRLPLCKSVSLRSRYSHPTPMLPLAIRSGDVHASITLEGIHLNSLSCPQLNLDLLNVQSGRRSLQEARLRFSKCHIIIFSFWPCLGASEYHESHGPVRNIYTCPINSHAKTRMSMHRSSKEPGSSLLQSGY